MEVFVVQFVSLLANVLNIAIFGRVILSWLNVGPSRPFYPIANILIQITEPILAPIRKVLPRFGMLDLSPMVALILLNFVVLPIVRRIL